MYLSGDGYRESLRRYRPTVFVNGRRVELVVDEPLLAPGVAAIAVTYDFALRGRSSPPGCGRRARGVRGSTG